MQGRGRGVAGRGRLVLLHEGLGSVGLWRGFPAALAAATGRRVIAFSRFGHGRSDPPRARARRPSSTRRRSRCCPRCSRSSASRSRCSSATATAPRSRSSTPAATRRRARAARAARVRRGRHGRGDPRDARAFRGRRCASGWPATTTTPTRPSTAGATCGSTRRSAPGASRPDAALVDCPVLLIQGADDGYATLEQLDRIEAPCAGPVERRRGPRRAQPAPGAARGGARRDQPRIGRTATVTREKATGAPSSSVASTRHTHASSPRETAGPRSGSCPTRWRRDRRVVGEPHGHEALGRRPRPTCRSRPSPPPARRARRRGRRRARPAGPRGPATRAATTPSSARARGPCRGRRSSRSPPRRARAG